MPAFLLVKVLAPAFYSRQDTRTPVKSAVLSVITNILATTGLLAGMLAWTGPGQAAVLNPQVPTTMIWEEGTRQVLVQIDRRALMPIRVRRVESLRPGIASPVALTRRSAPQSTGGSAAKSWTI